MVAMGSTFAFAVLTLYSGYHWFTTRNEHLKEIALADISWCIYYVGFCIITVQGGSSVTRTVKNNYFKLINIIVNKFNEDITSIIQGKKISTLIHEIINKCENEAVTSKVLLIIINCASLVYAKCFYLIIFS